MNLHLANKVLNCEPQLFFFFIPSWIDKALTSEQFITFTLQAFTGIYGYFKQINSLLCSHNHLQYRRSDIILTFTQRHLIWYLSKQNTVQATCTWTKTRVRGVQFSRWVTFRGGRTRYWPRCSANTRNRRDCTLSLTGTPVITAMLRSHRKHLSARVIHAF